MQTDHNYFAGYHGEAAARRRASPNSSTHVTRRSAVSAAVTATSAPNNFMAKPSMPAWKCLWPLIYNTLNQFTEAGLLREVAVEGHKSYFDTNTSNHYHYYLEGRRPADGHPQR
jgi:hypothetical protein